MFGFPFVVKDPIDDRLNWEVAHEHYEFDDGRNIGFGIPGWFPDTEADERRSHYERSSKYYRDDIMEEALENLKKRNLKFPFLAWPFNPKTFNCQEAAEELRKEYERLLLQGPSGTSTNVTISDPNQKIGPTGFGANGFLSSDTLMAYRVDFENETNATAPSQQTVITDRLSTNLDWSTLQWTEIGWGDQLIVVPPNTQHFETNVPMSYLGTSFEVQVEAGIHLSSGQAYVTFRSIDPATGLPPAVEIGFLPPEDGTGRGQGHFAYTLRPKPNLPTGTQIRNVALISFDNQPAIATNQRDPHDPSQGTDPTKEALNTIDADPPTSTVAPLLPIQANCSFQVCWSGTDAGSGVISYDIYVSTNGGPQTLWLAGTTETCATFDGQGGNTYAFYSIARDGAGNTQTVPSAEATTTVTAPCLSDVRLTIDHSTLPEGQGERITLSYPVLPSRTYTVEFRDTLDASVTWQPLPGAPHNTGVVTETNILTQRFYRVRINQ
jgi:hypothetical protein